MHQQKNHQYRITIGGDIKWHDMIKKKVQMMMRTASIFEVRKSSIFTLVELIHTMIAEVENVLSPQHTIAFFIHLLYCCVVLVWKPSWANDDSIRISEYIIC